MPSEESRSNFGLVVILSLTYMTSRSTANRCSLMPLIISPSTKALAGAPVTSSLMPRSSGMIWMSKDL